jgi:hypothetical protein
VSRLLNGTVKASSFAVQVLGATAVKLAAPSKLSRKVLKLPGSIWAQDKLSRLRRQLKSARNIVQNCACLCKISARTAAMGAKDKTKMSEQKKAAHREPEVNCWRDSYYCLGMKRLLYCASQVLNL